MSSDDKPNKKAADKRVEWLSDLIREILSAVISGAILEIIIQRLH